MKAVLQNRELLPRGHFKDTVWSLCSFQAIRRQSLNLVGVAGFCSYRVWVKESKAFALCWKTSTEGGGVGPAGCRTCRLTMNRPLWGIQLPYQLCLDLNSGILCPSLSFVPSPVVIVNATSLTLYTFPHATEKNVNRRRHFKNWFWQGFSFCKAQLSNTGSRKGGVSPILS